MSISKNYGLIAKNIYFMGKMKVLDIDNPGEGSVVMAILFGAKCMFGFVAFLVGSCAGFALFVFLQTNETGLIWNNSDSIITSVVVNAVGSLFVTVFVFFFVFTALLYLFEFKKKRKKKTVL